MNEGSALYDDLAGLFAYPDDGYLERLDKCRCALSQLFPEATTHLARFSQNVGALTTEQLQEKYTQTFDLDPVCSLEIGWHLFGENYNRGEFLVELRRTLRRLELTESTELPDHLSNVLPILGRLPQREADRFVSRYLLPALEKMLSGLSGSDGGYACLLEAVREVVLSPYAAVWEGVCHD